MAISIVPGSGKITKIQGGKSVAPTISGGIANFSVRPSMHTEGEVQFNGLPGDPIAGWHVGWIQAEWVETNWANYEGQFNGDGSMFLQRGRAPARAIQACRDTSGAVATIFTDPTDPREFQNLVARRFPQTVKVQSNDPPGERYRTIENNFRTGKPNFIQEVQLEFHFCTILTVQDPTGAFHHQAHFYWNAHWQFRFRPTAFPAPTDAQWTIHAVPGSNTSGVSHAFAGAPNDRRFTAVLTTPQRSSCVDLAGISETAVRTRGNASRREFAVWTPVDVRH
ncbi:MAG TPA: hypothetical protein VG168_06570 [Bryobacteraceae bacterium]|nr:hypothetical protein [Bryobacteraceae bacterium]